MDVIADAPPAGNVAAQPPPAPPRAEAAAAAVHLADYYAENPTAWFAFVDSVFETSRIRASRTKFNYAFQKLPLSMFDTISDIQQASATSEDPYGELKTRLTNSFGLGKEARLAAFLDHPGLGDFKPSVLLDRIWALRPDSVDAIAYAIFYRRLPAYIVSAAAGHKFEDRNALGVFCNQIYDAQGGAAAAHAAMAATAAGASRRPFHSPGRADRRHQSSGRASSSGHSSGGGARASRRRSPTPGAAKQYPDAAGHCYYHARYQSRARNCRQPCSFQENGEAGGGN